MNKLEILSYIANGVLLVWAVVERVLSEKDKSYIKASIRIWQHQANGIASAINKLSWSSGRSSMDSFSKTKDVGIALNALHDVAESMSQSLYESRFFTDEELKENIRKDKQKDSLILEESKILTKSKK